MSIGAIGKLTAGIIALVAAGLLIYSFAFAPSTAPTDDAAAPPGEAAPVGTGDDADGVGGRARSLADRGSRESAAGGEATAGVDRGTDAVAGEAGGDAVITRVDPETGELEFRLTFAEFTPIDQVRARIVEPRAFIYQGDRVVIVSADEASVITPSRNETPESGTLIGDVVVEVKPIEAADDAGVEPDARLRTERLRFQTTLGQLETSEPIVLTAAGLVFRGTGLTARGSEQQGRLQYLRIERDIDVAVEPGSLGDGGSGEDDDAAVEAGDQERDDAKPHAPLRVDLYRLSLGGELRLNQADRRLSADEMEVFARLVNGSLPDDAVRSLGSFAGEDEDAPTTGATEEGRASDEEPAAGGARLTLTASGPLEVTPLSSTPRELTNDDLYGRLRSPASGRVTLADEAAGVSLDAGSIGYGFRSRTLAVRGVGGELGVDVKARLDDGRAARLLVGAVDVELDAGVAQIPGAGELRLFPSDAAAGGMLDGGRLRWIERADVRFELVERPRADLLPIQMTASGEVRGEWGRAEVTGQFVRADFASIESSADDGARASRFREVAVTGNATARIDPESPTEQSAVVTAETIAVLFDTLEAARGSAQESGGGAASETDAATDLVVTAATATGGVNATFEGDELTADAASIDFVPGAFSLQRPSERGDDRPRGRTLDDATGEAMLDREAPSGIRRFEATGEASIVTAEGYELSGSQVVFRGAGERLELTGAPARAAVFVDDRGLAAGADFTRGVSVTAPSLRLERETARLVAFGDGAASFALRNEVVPSPTNRWRLYDRGVLRFTESMIVDDGAGSAEFLGGVEGVFDRLDVLERFEVQAERAEVSFVAGRSEAGAEVLGRGGSAEDSESTGLDVVTAVSLEASPGEEAPPAFARLRRFNAPPAAEDEGAPPTIEAGGSYLLVELASAAIDADTRLRSVTTPAAGALRIVDLREREASTAAASPGSDARGATSFQWAGSFELIGSENAATMTRGVRMAHLPPEAAEVVLVECERLEAFAGASADEASGGADEAALGDVVDPFASALTLERVIASGAVWARQGPIQLVGDELRYVRATRELLAQARRGNRVTIFDADTARHFNAQAITLDLEDNTWRATGAEATTSPD